MAEIGSTNPNTSFLALTAKTDEERAKLQRQAAAITADNDKGNDDLAKALSGYSKSEEAKKGQSMGQYLGTLNEAAQEDYRQNYGLEISSSAATNPAKPAATAEKKPSYNVSLAGNNDLVIKNNKDNSTATIQDNAEKKEATVTQKDAKGNETKTDENGTIISKTEIGENGKITKTTNLNTDANGKLAIGSDKAIKGESNSADKSSTTDGQKNNTETVKDAKTGANHDVDTVIDKETGTETKTEYDEKGKKVKETIKQKDGKTEEIEYDEKNNAKKITGERTETKIDPETGAKTETEFKNGKKMKETITHDDGSIDINEYRDGGTQLTKTTKTDKENNKVEIVPIYNDKGEKTGSTEKKLDKDGKVIETTAKDKDGKVTETKKGDASDSAKAKSKENDDFKELIKLMFLSNLAQSRGGYGPTGGVGAAIEPKGPEGAYKGAESRGAQRAKYGIASGQNADEKIASTKSEYNENLGKIRELRATIAERKQEFGENYSSGGLLGFMGHESQASTEEEIRELESENEKLGQKIQTLDPNAEKY